VPAKEPAKGPDPKEVILNQIRRFIKTNKGQTKLSQDLVKEAEASGDKTEEIIKNLRDFLGYLESKGIINQSKLQNKDEMKNLLKDIMKLDLAKFSRPRNNSQPVEPSQKRKVAPSPVMSQLRTPAEQMQIVENKIDINHYRNNSAEPLGKHTGHRVRTEASNQPSSERPSTQSVYSNGIIKDKKTSINFAKSRRDGRNVVTEQTSESPKNQPKKQVSLNSVNFVLPTSTAQTGSVQSDRSKFRPQE
jgi:hypothetical protein